MSDWIRLICILLLKHCQSIHIRSFYVMSSEEVRKLPYTVHKLPGNSSLNVRSLCPVYPVCPGCPGFPVCPDDMMTRRLYTRKSEVVWSHITSNLLVYGSWRLSDQMRAHCRVDRSEWWIMSQLISQSVSQSLTNVGLELLGQLKIIHISPVLRTQALTALTSSFGLVWWVWFGVMGMVWCDGYGLVRLV